MTVKYDVSRIKCLKDIHKDKDIKPLFSATYPGFHCPLYAALMTSLIIHDAAVLVVGTRECAFYSKALACRTSPRADALYSFAADRNDITFGCSEQVKNAVKKIDAEGKFKALIIITTCVMELIGEDIPSVLEDVQKETSLKIMTVRTEHYTKDTPVSGLVHTLACLADVMKPQKKEKNLVNIIGPRSDEFSRSELAEFLKKSKLDINIQIPGKCSIQGLEKAPAAVMNILTHFSSLELAEKMKKEFDMEYVFFNQSLAPDKIYDNYKMVEKIMGVNFGREIVKRRDDTIDALDELKKIAGGKSFIFSGPAIFSLKISSFLCDAEMTPLWIQTAGLFECDGDSVRNIIEKGYNPKVSMGKTSLPADLPTQTSCPDYHFDVQIPSNGKKAEGRRISLMKELMGVGFEQSLNIIKKILMESHGLL